MKIKCASIESSELRESREFKSSTRAHHSQKKGYRVRQSLSHPKTIKNSVYTKPKTNKQTQDWERLCAKDVWIYSGNTKFGSRVQELTKYKN